MFAEAGMCWSMVNGSFPNALVNAVPVVMSVHIDGRGGELRLTSFCQRQAKGFPAWLTWMVWAVSALLTVHSFPAAVKVVEAVVLLVDDHDVPDLAQRIGAACARREHRPSGCKHERGDDQDSSRACDDERLRPLSGVCNLGRASIQRHAYTSWPAQSEFRRRSLAPYTNRSALGWRHV